MAKCAVCGKGAHFGIKVSHSHRRSNRKWNSNVKRVKIGRNEPCPCGSGKKYKNCCGRNIS